MKIYLYSIFQKMRASLEKAVSQAVLTGKILTVYIKVVVHV